MQSELTPNTPYLACLTLNLWACCWQAGFGLAGNNIVGGILADQMNWRGNAGFYNTIISSVAIAGMTLGSLFAGLLTVHGRRKALIISNYMVFIATACVMVLNFYTILVGRFILGFAAGVILQACVLYIAETIPASQREIFGLAVNNGIISGILITNLFGLILPLSGTEESSKTQLWRVSVGFGLLPAMITQFLFQTTFKEESLKYIIQQGDKNQRALPFLKKIYKLQNPKLYKRLLFEEKQLARHQGVETGDATPNTRFRKESEVIGYSQVLWSPLYRRCTYVLCLLSIFNQTTGVNAINVYSQSIFENIMKSSGGGISPRVGNIIITVAQLIASTVSPVMIRFFGFKQIFVGGLVLMAIALGLIGVFAKLGMNTALIVMTSVDLAIYQLTLGYFLVYVGIVSEERAANICNFVNWILMLLLMMTTIILFEKLGSEGTFWLFSGLSLVGAIVMQLTLREIKDLTKEAIKQLYMPESLKDNRFYVQYVGTPSPNIVKRQDK